MSKIWIERIDNAMKCANRIFAGCVSRHGHLRFERTADGIASYRCERCDEVLPIPWK